MIDISLVNDVTLQQLFPLLKCLSSWVLVATVNKIFKLVNEDVFFQD